MSVVELSAPPMRSEDWDVFRVPEPYRAEIVQGELVVTPAASPTHGLIQQALGRLLHPYLPPSLRVVSSVEWRFDEHGVVAMAPQPDLMVLHQEEARGKRLTEAPVLAVEILSPSDANRLERSFLSRIEGKRLDYADRGLRDYLEVDLAGQEPVLICYQLQDGDYLEVGRAVGRQLLVSDRPFRYELRPSDLIA